MVHFDAFASCCWVPCCRSGQNLSLPLEIYLSNGFSEEFHEPCIYMYLSARIPQLHYKDFQCGGSSQGTGRKRQDTFITWKPGLSVPEKFVNIMIPLKRTISKQGHLSHGLHTHSESSWCWHSFSKLVVACALTCLKIQTALMQDNASFWRNYDELVTVELDVPRCPTPVHALCS